MIIRPGLTWLPYWYRANNNHSKSQQSLCYLQQNSWTADRWKNCKNVHPHKAGLSDRRFLIYILYLICTLFEFRTNLFLDNHLTFCRLAKCMSLIFFLNELINSCFMELGFVSEDLRVFGLPFSPLWFYTFRKNSSAFDPICVEKQTFIHSRGQFWKHVSGVVGSHSHGTRGAIKG